MKLRTRIMLVTVGGLITILVFFSLLIYVYFVRVTTDAEVQLLWNRAQIILRKPEIRETMYWQDNRLLEEFLVPRTMIRIIDPSGTVRSQAANDEGLPKLRAVYRTAYHTRIIPAGTIRRVYIQVPILELPERRQVGVLEVARAFSLTRGYLRMLLITLASGTVIGILFSVCLGILYVRWIYKPIGQLAGTMEEIEHSGEFGRLSGEFVSGGDEFGRLGATFNKMISRLEDNYKRQRHFVEDASHELRTPLTVIQSYAGMLRRWGASDPALRDEAVAAIERESSRLKQLVLSLLQSAEGRGERINGLIQTLDLSDLANRTARELSLSFDRDILVENAPGGDGQVLPAHLQIEGDQEKLKQLLIILLDNAISYSQEAVMLRLEGRADEIACTITDRGVGIAEEHLPHLFDRFYRVDHSRARHPGGSGLGLSIAKRIVEEHGGAVSVESEPGQGTSVTVILPRKQKTVPGEGTV